MDQIVMSNVPKNILSKESSGWRYVHIMLTLLFLAPSTTLEISVQDKK